MKNVDFYCYYKIIPEKYEEFRSLAARITDVYRSHPDYKSFTFSIGSEPGRRFTAMESGTCGGIEAFERFKERIEGQNPELFARLDDVIQGGLNARKYEFFTPLTES